MVLALWAWLPKSQKFQNGFVDRPSPVFVTANPFSRYLAPLGAKYIEKMPKKYKNAGSNLLQALFTSFSFGNKMKNDENVDSQTLSIVL